MLQHEIIDISEWTDTNKTSGSKECVKIKILVINLNPMFLKNVLIDWWLLIN